MDRYINKALPLPKYCTFPKINNYKSSVWQQSPGIICLSNNTLFNSLHLPLYIKCRGVKKKSALPHWPINAIQTSVQGFLILYCSARCIYKENHEKHAFFCKGSPVFNHTLSTYMYFTLLLSSAHLASLISATIVRLSPSGKLYWRHRSNNILFFFKKEFAKWNENGYCTNAPPVWQKTTVGRVHLLCTNEFYVFGLIGSSKWHVSIWFVWLMKGN